MATDTSAGVAYIDGEFIPIGEASVPILDLGFLRSDATYDVVAVWKGKFFRLDKHLDRFFAGLAKLRLELPVDRDGLTRVLADCVRRAGIDDAYVEVIATRGMPVAGSRDIRLCVNRMYCFAIPYVWIATPEQRERGIRLVVGRTERISNKSVDPRIKNYHWLDFEQALLSAYDSGGDNVVLSDGKGLVTEGAGFNVFIVRDGVLQTPATNVLEGITRHTVLDIARELGIPAEVGEVSVDRLRSADEAFGASTAGGVFFVTSVDGTPLGDGRIGPLTQRIQDTYWAWHDDPRFTLAVSDVPPCED
ncbi:MAG: branched-chain amino acid aminotransferase [Gaiellales bacterium]|nr:branched-chain amino acid aminotransferase [Gaiellales bacterium]